MERELEKLIDENGLVQVMDIISTICFEKEDHVLTNWQDKALAKVWRRNGIILQTATEKLFDLP